MIWKFLTCWNFFLYQAFSNGGMWVKSGLQIHSCLALSQLQNTKQHTRQWCSLGPHTSIFEIRWVVSHGNPEKIFPSNVLISLEAEKSPLSLIENPHISPFRKFFYDHSKVELFSFLCSNFYKKILSITRQCKDATAVAQLTLILNARVSYHKCQTHN